MPDIYDVGDVARLAATFQNLAGALADPATISLGVTDPTGILTTYTYAGSQITRDGTGQYHRDISLAAAAVGTWDYVWTTTGDPATETQGYFTVRIAGLTEIVRDIRRSVRDFPDVTWVVDNPMTSGAAVLTMPDADTVKFPKSGMTLEFDDRSAERVKTTAAADSTADTVAIRRGQDGTAASAHSLDTPVLIEPRLSRAEIVNALSLVVDSELWPQVWQSGEMQVSYQATNEYYPATVPDIMECTYAYQLSGGLIYPCHVDFLQPQIADQTNFPLGAIILRRPMDVGPIFVAYRAKPSIGTLSGVCRNLALLGTTAHLLMLEEAFHVGPAASAVDKRVTDGSKLRAGATMWQRFEAARSQASVSLASQEAAVRSRFVRAVR